MKIPEASAGERLDRVVSKLLQNVSVREARGALEDGRIRVDGRRRKPGERARGGESIDVAAFTQRSLARIDPDPELLARVSILYEDPELLALDKPSGVHTSPVRVGDIATLLHAAVAYDACIARAGPPLEGGLVHRLDQGTSGVVLFARVPEARARLRAAFKAHEVEKRYLALVEESQPLVEGLVIREPLANAGDHVRIKADGAFAETVVLRRVPRRAGLVFLELSAKTGHRHQLRVHLASVGAPIRGDSLYGSPSAGDRRLALHASWLKAPGISKPIESPWPVELDG